MNRNNEAHFNQIPQIHISRSRFKRDQDIKLTFSAGKLIPFYVDEVLPGDTFSVDTAGLVRMTTPIFPVMDNCYLDLYYFFVPNRIVWNHWKQFMGENDTTAWVNETEYTVPQIVIGSKSSTTTNIALGPREDSILDYMGIPTKLVTEDNKATYATSVNALPIRGYVKIWNEFFRDQNVDNPALLSTGDNNITYLDDGERTDIEQILQWAERGGRCLPVNKFHDYFTSCLPAPQKGPAVSLPMSGNAAIKAYTEQTLKPINEKSFNGYFSSTASNRLYNASIGTNGTSDDPNRLEIFYSNAAVGTSAATGVWLGADLSTVSAATINELRQAFAVQHYYEALARGGSRYREIIRSVFGTLISDKTVQIPEYLGGDRYMINMNQVIQTSATDSQSPQGNPGAISVTPFRSNSFTKSFEEHGFVIGVMCVRHDRTYQQGIERMWSRKDMFDYYFPQFANIGEQAVLTREIMAGDLSGIGGDEEDVFGYQEAWADYRMKPNRVCGKMRSNAEGTLDSWHYADWYKTEAPTLSSKWMKEGEEEIQRTIAVDNEPQFFGDLMIANKTTRPMPLYSVPGIDKL